MHRNALLTWLTHGYVGFIAIWMLARILIFDQFWLLAMLNTVAEYLFVPLPILLIFSIWKRDGVSLAQLSIPALIFLFLFGHLFWPTFPSDGAEDKQAITIMSFNVLYTNSSYAEMVDSIQSANPDLIGFQELTPTIAASIIEELERDYPYNTFQLVDTRIGTAVLSKFPIERAERFEMPPLHRALHTVLQMDGTKIHVIVVHLTHNNFFNPSTNLTASMVNERYGYRKAETIQLTQMVQDLDGPVLLLCDCNLTDTSEAYARLDTVLDDSFSETGWGMGHTLLLPPLYLPTQRIDYIWHTEEFEAISAYVGQDGDSDHLPVVAKLNVVKTP